MKSRKHVLKIAAFFAVVAMLLGCTISTWARDIKKGYRVYPGTSSFSLELNSGESISKIKVNKKGLKVKVRANNYSEDVIVDKAKNAEYNKENPKDPVKDNRTISLRTFSTKPGKYKVTFNIKKGKKTIKKKQKITVYVGLPLTSVKFAGKTYKILGKYQGSKYWSPFYSSYDFITKKSKGKFSAKAGYGYKVVGITYEKYNEKKKEYETVVYKKGASLPLYKRKGESETYNRDYAGTKHTYKYAPDYSYTSIVVYLRDTLEPKNNDNTSKYVKGTYATSVGVEFEKF